MNENNILISTVSPYEPPRTALRWVIYTEARGLYVSSPVTLKWNLKLPPNPTPMDQNFQAPLMFGPTQFLIISAGISAISIILTISSRSLPNEVTTYSYMLTSGVKRGVFSDSNCSQLSQNIKCFGRIFQRDLRKSGLKYKPPSRRFSPCAVPGRGPSRAGQRISCKMACPPDRSPNPIRVQTSLQVLALLYLRE